MSPAGRNFSGRDGQGCPGHPRDPDAPQGNRPLNVWLSQVAAIVRVPVKLIHDYPVLRLKAAGASDLDEFRGLGEAGCVGLLLECEGHTATNISDQNCCKVWTDSPV